MLRVDVMSSQIKVPNVLTKTELLKLPPQERELYVREILRQTLNLNSVNGVTISTLTKNLPFDPRTLEKHLSILTYTNEVYAVNIGPTALYLPNSRAMHSITQKTLNINGREYSIYELENRLGQFIFIQEKKKQGYTNEIRGGILIPKAGFAQFINYLKETANGLQKGDNL